MAKRRFLQPVFFHCLLPLLAGGIIYLVFRPTDLLIRTFHLKQQVTVTHPLLKPLLFILPDFCWSYSLACALYLFSIASFFNFNTSIILVSVLIIGAELVQLVFPYAYTFDVLDLLAAISALILATLQMKHIAYEKDS